MIHVAGCDDQRGPIYIFNDLCDGTPECLKLLQVIRSDRDRRESSFGSADLLHEWQLNFSGVFKAMRLEIVHKEPVSSHQRVAHRFINLNLAERGLPRTRFHDRKRRTETCVIGTKNNITQWKFDKRIHRAGNVSGVNIAGVGDNDPDGFCGLLSAFKETLDRV